MRFLELKQLIIRSFFKKISLYTFSVKLFLIKYIVIYPYLEYLVIQNQAILYQLL